MFQPFRYGQVAVSSTPVQIFPVKTLDSQINILNIDIALTIYLGDINVTTSTGYPLAPGAAITVPTTGALYGVSVSGTPALAFIQVQS
jgi:hypothetical protein